MANLHTSYVLYNRSIAVIFDSVSRMRRNASEGFLLYKELFERNVSLVFLKERHIDTERLKVRHING